MPTRPLRQQRHRPRTPTHLGDTATNPAHPHQHANPGPTCRKDVLQRELGEVDAVLSKAPEEPQ